MVWNQKKGRVILFRNMGWVEFKFRIWIQKNSTTRVQTSNINSKSKRKDYAYKTSSNIELILAKTTLVQQDLFICQAPGITRDWNFMDMTYCSAIALKNIFIIFAWIGTSIYELILELKNKSKTQAKQSKNSSKNYHKLFVISRAHGKKMTLRN